MEIIRSRNISYKEVLGAVDLHEKGFTYRFIFGGRPEPRLLARVKAEEKRRVFLECECGMLIQAWPTPEEETDGRLTRKCANCGEYVEAVARVEATEYEPRIRRHIRELDREYQVIGRGTK